MSLLYTDDLDQAEIALQRATEYAGQDSMLTVTEAMLWAKRGESERATELLETALERRQSLSHDHHTHQYAAAVHATLGDGASAVRELTRAADKGMPNYPAFLHDQHFAALRERDDYRELLAGLKNRWLTFKAEFGETP
jgi:hypothetical protein